MIEKETSNNEIPNDVFDIVYADPPWPQKKGNIRNCRPNQTKELDYPTLSVSEIQKIILSVCVSEKHDFFIWTIDKFLFQCERMMEEKGYSLHARFIWDKENGIAPAMTVRFSHEYLLWFYKKGSILMPCESQRGKFSTVMREKSTYHSHKPTCAYEMLEAMFPGSRKIELFARNKRDGWTSWGNEICG